MVDLKTDIKFKAVLTVQCGSQKQKHCTQQLGQLILSKLSVIHIKLPINSILFSLNLDRKPQEKKRHLVNTVTLKATLSILQNLSNIHSHSYRISMSIKAPFTLTSR